MNILLVGGPGTFMDRLIQKIRKENHRVYLLTGQQHKSGKYESVFERYDFPYDSANIRFVFDSVSPDVIIYTGAYDTNYNFAEDRSAGARFSAGVTSLLLCFAASQHNGRFIYLSSEKVFSEQHEDDIMENTLQDSTDVAAMVFSQAENTCMQWARNANLDIVILRIDHMTIIPQGLKEVDEIVSRMTLEAMEHKQITCRPNAKLSLLSWHDAVEYINVIIKRPTHHQTIYHLSSAREISERELADMVFQKLEMEPHIVTASSVDARRLLSNRAYDSEFGQRLFETTEELVESVVLYMKLYPDRFLNGGLGGNSWMRRLYHRVNWFIRLIIPYLENMAAFIPFFMLNNRAVGSRYFAKLDFYLLYVLLFSITHGQTQAVFSSVLAVAGYCFRQMYTRTGFDVAMDYNTYVWIAQLFIIGLSVGHVHDQNAQLRAEAAEDRDYLSKQILDIEEINNTNVRVKNTYEDQLINQQDSLGKVYSITSSLDQYHPDEVLFYAVEMLAKLLNCKDVSLYIVSNADYARLFTATSADARLLGGSIRYRELPGIYDDLEAHRVFINKKMDERFPMMAAGVYEGEKLLMIAMFWKLPWKSMTLGSANMLAVACSLIQSFSSRAIRYMDAMKEHRYIGTTKVLSESAFRSLVNAYSSAQVRTLTEYTLLQVSADSSKQSGTLQEQGIELVSSIRNSDYVGQLDDNSLFVLLANTPVEAAQIVLQRFEKKGFLCKVLSELPAAAESSDFADDAPAELPAARLPSEEH